MTTQQNFRALSIIGAFLVGIWVPLSLLNYFPDYDLRDWSGILVTLVAGANLYLYFQKENNNIRNWKAWINLWVIVDVLCILPLPLTARLILGHVPVPLILLNLLVIQHTRHIKSFLDYFDHLQPILYRLVPIFVMMPLLLHLVACSWIALGSGTAGPDPDKSLEYVRALYWAFTTLTTVGYGDISAKTEIQMLFTCGVQLVGVGFFGFIVSNVASLLARRDAAREHHMDNLDKIETFMKSHRIPDDLRNNVRSYYNYMWRNKKGYRENSVVGDLPKKIQSDLFLHINKPILQKVPFLRDASADLVEDLMHQLESIVVVPGEKIFVTGDPGDAMYFIYRGQVDIVGQDNQIKATLSEGAFFGEMALIAGRSRTATARASQFCDLYILKKDAFDKVCSKYPEFLDHIHQVMRMRSA